MKEPGFETLEIGKTYESANGTSILIKNMVINANGMRPWVMVTYRYLTADLRSGIETNSFEIVVQMLREK